MFEQCRIFTGEKIKIIYGHISLIMNPEPYVGPPKQPQKAKILDWIHLDLEIR